MKCLTSCPKYDAWLDPATDWQAANPCDTCDHQQEFGAVGGSENAGL